MLYVKGDYYLNEYVTALKHALELALPIQTPIPSSVGDESMKDETAVKDFSLNLYEHY